MITLPPGVRVWLATGHTDMRKGFATLALLVQEKLKTDPHGGHLFVFRGRRGDLIKVIWHAGRRLRRLQRPLRGRPHVLLRDCPVPRLRFPLPRQNLLSFPRLLHDSLTQSNRTVRTFPHASLVR